jgi:hypothetical protein
MVMGENIPVLCRSSQGMDEVFKHRDQGPGARDQD